MAEAARELVSYEEYLELEERSDVKHEWYDGHVIAMAGGTLDHALLSMNLGVQLSNALRGRPCRVLSSDGRIRPSASRLATYPDASVVCGQRITHPEDRNALTNPIAIGEVLSEGSEVYDRSDKFEVYKQIPSLRDYVLVNYRKVLIEVWSRLEDERWVMTAFGPGEKAILPGLEIRIPVDEVYAGAELLESLTASPPLPEGSSGV